MESVETKASEKDQGAAEKEEQSKRKKNQGVDNNVLGFPLAQEQEDSDGDLQKEADKPLAQKFKTYELTLKDIQNILMYWDRKQGIQVPHVGAEDLAHEPDDQRQVPSGGRKGRKDRERERAEKERLERERLERERAERERLERLRALEEQPDGGEADREEDHEGKKDLGVPFINIQTPDLEGSKWKQILENDKLPKAEQVQTLLEDEDVTNQGAGTGTDPSPGWGECNQSGSRYCANRHEGTSFYINIYIPLIPFISDTPLDKTLMAKRAFFCLERIHI